jgi:hypothetical protein
MSFVLQPKGHRAAPIIFPKQIGHNDLIIQFNVLASLSVMLIFYTCRASKVISILQSQQQHFSKTPKHEQTSYLTE